MKRKNFIYISIFLILVLSIIVYKFSSNVYAESTIQYIYTVEDLININDNLAGDYVLMNNIDLSVVDSWEPIGDSIDYLADKVNTGYTETDTGNYFTGTLDGNGYKIMNLAINEQPEAYYTSESGKKINSYGLFSHISGAEIKNLILSGVHIDITVVEGSNEQTYSSKTIVGMISASAQDSIITDCQFLDGTINVENETYSAGSVAIDLGNCTYNNILNCINSNMSAGIVGACDPGTVVTNCVNKGNISGVAGIAGGGSIAITNCYNYGDISGRGGIIGRGYAYNSEHNLQLENCFNYGDINFTSEADSFFVGGIAGDFVNQSGTATLKNCVNYGNVNIWTVDQVGGAISGVGGLVGQADLISLNTDISNCVNRGNITIDFEDCISEKAMNVGGIFGDYYGKSSISVDNMLNYGKVDVVNFNSQNIWLGGITGYSVSGNFTNSINFGQLNVENAEDGGLGYISIGGVYNGESSLLRCGNEGDIFLSGNIYRAQCGGISIHLSTDDFSDIYNIGDITVIDNNVVDNEIISIGGLWATVIGNDININNAYNMGNIVLEREDITIESVNIGTIYANNPMGRSINASNCFVSADLSDIRYGSGDLDILDSIYELDDFTDEDAFTGFDFSDTWEIKDTHPTLVNTFASDDVAPTIIGHTTNECQTSQTLSFQVCDNEEIVGYYWGTDVFSYVDVASTTEYSTQITVNKPDTYYFIAVDAAGNETGYEVAFFKTSLNANGGTVTPSYVITKSDYTTMLPVPNKTDSSFVGWGDSLSATSGVKLIMPLSNKTYYAVWEDVIMLGDVNGDGVIDAGDAGLISRYDAGFITFTKSQLSAGDVNNDGVVDAGDSGLISRYDAGFISAFK